MPRDGFKSVTMNGDMYDLFYKKWLKAKHDLQPRGINSFSGFITATLRGRLEDWFDIKTKWTVLDICQKCSKELPETKIKVMGFHGLRPLGIASVWMECPDGHRNEVRINE